LPSKAAHGGVAQTRHGRISGGFPIASLLLSHQHERMVEPRVSDPLVRALAEMVRSAVDNEQRLVGWAIKTGTALAQPCHCRVEIGDNQCICNVEPSIPRAYLIRASARLAAGRFVGMPPRRRCLLCLQGDHDLAETTIIKIVGRDGQAGEIRIAAPRRRTRRQDRDRADRARAFPAGTWDELRRAAGIGRREGR
jgi:hypothetical protein